MPVITAAELADYLLVSFREAGELLTNLKLQKLAYYAQAWRLAIDNEPLIREDFEAWVHGPVCPEIYRRFRSFRWEPINLEIDLPEFPADVSEHLDDVIRVYGGFGAWELERMVHREAPWIDARGGIPPDEPCENVIPPQAMKDFYRSLMPPDGENPAS